jgi:hypothetical protein
VPSSSVSNSPRRVAELPTTPTEKLLTDGDLREAQVSILSFIQPKRRTERSAGLGVVRTCNWDRAYAKEFPVLSFSLEVSIMRTCAASGSIPLVSVERKLYYVGVRGGVVGQ